jgi:hypothetical protein
MARRWLPIGLALLAATLDASGLHVAAFYFLVAAVPATAVSALGALGDVLDARAGGRAGAALVLQPLLWASALALLVVSAALRASAIGGAGVPALSTDVLTGCLALLCVEALVALFAETSSARPGNAAPILGREHQARGRTPTRQGFAALPRRRVDSGAA